MPDYARLHTALVRARSLIEHADIYNPDIVMPLADCPGMSVRGAVITAVRQLQLGSRVADEILLILEFRGVIGPGRRDPGSREEALARLTDTIDDMATLLPTPQGQTTLGHASPLPTGTGSPSKRTGSSFAPKLKRAS